MGWGRFLAEGDRKGLDSAPGVPYAGSVVLGSGRASSFVTCFYFVMKRISLLLGIAFAFTAFVATFDVNAQSLDNETIANSKGVAIVYVAYDASLTRFHTPLDGSTKNAHSPLGITLGAGTAFDTFLNGVVEASVYEVDEPIHPSFDLVSETQIWSFMGGLKLQDPNQGIFWDLLFGLSSHTYNFEDIDLGDAGRSNGFAMSTSMNIPIVLLKRNPVIVSFGVRKVFAEDTGHINYSLGLKVLQIFTR